MPEPRIQFRAVLSSLNQHGVRFVLIGGVAMRLHGSAHETDDLDIVYARDPDNLTAVVETLSNQNPRLRTAAGDIPFLWDARTLKFGLNFTLRTDIGDIDLLGEAAGSGPFEELWARSVEMDLDGIRVHVASLDDLIAMKRAANRPKDRTHLMELEALRELIQSEEAAISEEEKPESE